MEYVCQIAQPRVSSRFVGKITVPQGGIKAGSIVVADTIDNAISGNYEVYTATTPSANNLNSNFFALVLNDGVETLLDNRRPSGQPNYYKYDYKEGDVAPVIFLDRHLRFFVGMDCINPTTKNLAVKGNYLIPVAGSVQLNASATKPANLSTALKIEGYYSVPIGGMSGGEFASALICSVELNEVDNGDFLFTFNVPNQVGSTNINHIAGTINLAVAGAKNNLVATFTASRDSKVTVNGVAQVSGTTANDFTNAVVYTVTSESGSSKTYTVTVSLAKYDLTINQGEGTTLSIKKGEDDVSAGTGALTYGDTLTITVDPEDSYLQVNGEEYVSGSQYVVRENVVVVSRTKE